MIDKNSESINDEIVNELKKKRYAISKTDIKKILEQRKDDSIKFRLLKEFVGRSRKNLMEVFGWTEDDIWNTVLPQILQDKLEILKRMNMANREVLYNVDFRILDERYISTLGEEKINLISCYPEFQEQILRLDDMQYEVFSECLNYYLASNRTENWTEVATILLDNVSSNEYSELISNIESDKVDIDRLVKILQNENKFQLKNSSDIENYEMIKKKRLDETVQNSKNIEEIKDAVLQKLFGQSEEYSKEVIKLFGEDIQNLHDCDEKDFVICLMEIMKLNDIEVLKEIYTSCDEIGLIDKTYMVQSIKREIFKEYKEKLYSTFGKQTIENNQIDDNDYLEKEFEGLKVYYAGTDFSMLVSAIGVVGDCGENINDYKQNWNRPQIDTQHFCVSYIRNDMLGVINNTKVFYGFINLSNDSLAKAGSGDIGSRRNNEVPIIDSDENREKYYTPNSQINNTEYYNEMDIFRFQNGQKINPSYIVAFRKGGKIENHSEIVKAYKDWKGQLPIVIVDIDRCLEKEKQDIDKIVDEYNSTQHEDDIKRIYQQLKQKTKNNINTTTMQCRHDKEIENFLNKVLETLEKDKAIQRDFGIRRQEIERVLKVKIDSLYYENKGFEKYDLAKYIFSTTKNILSSKDESEYNISELYQNCLGYFSNRLSKEFSSSYKRFLNPQEYIDKDDWFADEEEQMQNIKDDYKNTLKKFQDLGIDVSEMLQWIVNNSKEVDEISIKEYIETINHIEYNREEDTTLDKNESTVTMEDLEENYKRVTAQEREQYISEMKVLRRKIKSIVYKESENDSKEME